MPAALTSKLILAEAVPRLRKAVGVLREPGWAMQAMDGWN